MNNLNFDKNPNLKSNNLQNKIDSFKNKFLNKTEYFICEQDMVGVAISKFIQCVKHGSTMRGLPVGPPRKPLQPLNKDDKRQLEQVIGVMNHTINLITKEGS